MFFGASLYCGYTAVQSFAKGFSILKTHLHNIVLEPEEAQIVPEKSFEIDAVGVLREVAVQSMSFIPTRTIGVIKPEIKSVYSLNPDLDIHLITQGQILDDNLPLSKIGIDALRVMTVASGIAGARASYSVDKAFDKNHPEIRLVLKLIFLFLDIENSKSIIKLPGWSGHWGKSAKSATTQLGDIFSEFGIYRVNRLYFSQLLQKKNDDGSYRQVEAFQLHKFIEFFSTTRLLIEDKRLAALEAFKEYRFEKLIIQGKSKYMSKEFSPNKEEWDFVSALQKAYREKFNEYITYNTLGQWFFNDPYYFRRCLHNVDEYHFLDDHLGMMEDIIKGRMEPKGTHLDLTLTGIYLDLVVDRLHKCKGSAEGMFKYHVSKESSSEEIILNLVRLGISRLKGGEFISFTSMLDEIGRSRNYLSQWKAFGFSAKDLELIIKYLEDKGLKILDAPLFGRIETAINKYNSMFKEYFTKFERVLINHYIGERVSPNKRNQYPSTFLNPQVRELQRQILFKFQGGRDMLTGEKFIDIYKRVNPDGLPLAILNSMSDAELETAVLKYIHRHHYKTWSQPFNKIDCRISALVGLFRENHARVTSDITSGSNYLNRQYESKFREAINAILQGKAPTHWDQQYRVDFESNLAHSLINPNIVSYLYRTSTQSYT